MGVMVKVLVIMDSSNLGVINRLMEDGSIRSYQVQPKEDVTHADPRKFAESIRRDESHHRNSHIERHRVNGVRVMDAVVTIMQTKPEEQWTGADIGMILESDYGFNRYSASSAFSSLVKHGYANRVMNNTYTLTDIAKKHPPNEQVPIPTR